LGFEPVLNGGIFEGKIRKDDLRERSDRKLLKENLRGKLS
jgi:hypothetical protein